MNRLRGSFLTEMILSLELAPGAALADTKAVVSLAPAASAGANLFGAHRDDAL